MLSKQIVCHITDNNLYNRVILLYNIIFKFKNDTICSLLHGTHGEKTKMLLIRLKYVLKISDIAYEILYVSTYSSIY